MESIPQYVHVHITLNPGQRYNNNEQIEDLNQLYAIEELSSVDKPFSLQVVDIFPSTTTQFMNDKSQHDAISQFLFKKEIESCCKGANQNPTLMISVAGPDALAYLVGKVLRKRGPISPGRILLLERLRDKKYHDLITIKDASLL